MNKKIIIAVFIIFLINIIFCAFVYESTKHSKTAFVDINKLYDGYVQKKELEKELEKDVLKQNNIIDSLSLQIKLLEGRAKANQKEVDTYRKGVEYYNYISSEFKRVNDEKVKKFKEQLLKRLNQFVADYGKEKGYKYIFGATGNGSLMYADDSENITDELITYSNTHYSGKK